MSESYGRSGGERRRHNGSMPRDPALTSSVNDVSASGTRGPTASFEGMISRLPELRDRLSGSGQRPASAIERSGAAPKRLAGPPHWTAEEHGRIGAGGYDDEDAVLAYVYQLLVPFSARQRQMLPTRKDVPAEMSARGSPRDSVSPCPGLA